MPRRFRRATATCPPGAVVAGGDGGRRRGCCCVAPLVARRRSRRSRRARAPSTACCPGRCCPRCSSTPSSSPPSSSIACGVLGLGAAWLVERTDLPFRRGLRGAAPAAARGPGVRRRLRVGVAGARRSRGCWGASLVMTLVALPARVPAGRGHAPSQRPRPRRGGPQAWASGRVRRFLRVTLPQVARPARRRHAARRALPAGRVRRLRDPPVPHLRHGHLHAVHAGLRRPGRVDPHARAVPHRRRPADGRVAGRTLVAPGPRVGPAPGARPASAGPCRWPCWRSWPSARLAIGVPVGLDRLLDGARQLHHAAAGVGVWAPRCSRSRSAGSRPSWPPRWRSRWRS